MKIGCFFFESDDKHQHYTGRLYSVAVCSSSLIVNLAEGGVTKTHQADLEKILAKFQKAPPVLDLLLKRLRSEQVWNACREQAHCLWL